MRKENTIGKYLAVALCLAATMVRARAEEPAPSRPPDGGTTEARPARDIDLRRATLEETYQWLTDKINNFCAPVWSHSFADNAERSYTTRTIFNVVKAEQATITIQTNYMVSVVGEQWLTEDHQEHATLIDVYTIPLSMMNDVVVKEYPAKADDETSGPAVRLWKVIISRKDFAHPNRVDPPTPIHVLHQRMKLDGSVNKVYNTDTNQMLLYFADHAIANRVQGALEHAISLCKDMRADNATAQ